MKLQRTAAAFCLAAGIFFSAAPADAAIQTIHATGVCQMGENDTIAGAKDAARNQALRNAAEQAGVYIRSYTATKNMQVTDDQIHVLAAQILKVEDCQFNKTFSNGTLIVEANVVVTVDDSSFEGLLKRELTIDRLQQQLDEEKAKNADIKKRRLQREGTGDMLLNAELAGCRDLIIEGHYNQAIWKLQHIKKERNGVVTGQLPYLMSVAAFGQNDEENAVRYADEAIRTDSKNPAFYTQKALVLLYSAYKDSTFYEAESLCTTALEKDRHYWPALLTRAMEKNLRHSPRKALEDCDDAMRSGGENSYLATQFRDRLRANYLGRDKGLFGYFRTESIEVARIDDITPGLMQEIAQNYSVQKKRQ